MKSKKTKTETPHIGVTLVGDRSDRKPRVLTRTKRIRMQTNFDTDTYPSLTQQQFAEGSTISKLMARHKDPAQIPYVNKWPGRYGIAPNTTFHEMQNASVMTKEYFRQLPVDVQKKFNGDIDQLFDFVENPENLAEAQEMGLLPEPEPTTSASAADAGITATTPPATPQNPNEAKSPSAEPPASPEGSKAAG